MNSMASYPKKTGPLWGSSPSSPSLTSRNRSLSRGQAWASATWQTGQSIISGILYHKKDYDFAQHHRNDYTSFRDEILMGPPAYDSIVPAVANEPRPETQTQALQHRSQSSPPAAPAAPQVAAVPRHQALELPPLPRLLGLENLDEWDDVLQRTLRFHGLVEYITAPYPGVPEPQRSYASLTPWSSRYNHSSGTALTHDQWAADRAAVSLLMVGSFSSDVRDTLLAFGYDPVEENPKVIHDLVAEALPRAAGEDVASWMAELSSITPADRRFEGSLREFCLRLQYLRRRLYQAEPQPNDNLVLVMAVLGLARCERYEGLSMALGRDLERGMLSWGRLMGDLSVVHGREVRERRRKAKGVGDNSGGS